MQISDAINSFLQQRRARQRAASTIEQYRYQLEDLWLPWRTRQGLPDDLARVTRAEIDAYFRYLAEEHINGRTGQVGLSAETISSSWRTLRAFWHFAIGQGWVSDAQRGHFQGRAVRMPAPAPAPGAAEHPALRDALLAACAQLTDREERTRNCALLRLLSDGLRPSELVALRDSDVNLRERCAWVRRPDGRVLVLGWGYDAAVALRSYMWARSGERGGPLFRSTYSQYAGQAISVSAVRRVIQHLARLAGVAAPLRVLVNSQRRRVLWIE